MTGLKVFIYIQPHKKIFQVFKQVLKIFILNQKYLKILNIFQIKKYILSSQVLLKLCNDKYVAHVNNLYVVRSKYTFT